MTFGKNLKTQMMLSAGLSALLGTATLSAQQRSEVADVPFAFHAQQQTFPAGEYQVTEKNWSASIFQLTSPNGKSIYVSAPLLETTDPRKPHLTFARHAGEYVLSGVSMPGKDIGHSVSQSAIDKNLNRKIGLAAMVSVTLKAR